MVCLVHLGAQPLTTARAGVEIGATEMLLDKLKPQKQIEIPDASHTIFNRFLKR